MESQRDRLATAIDIRAWLAADAAAGSPAVAHERRLARDRRIGKSLTEKRPRDRVLAWWSKIERPGSGTDNAPGEKVAAFVSVGGGILLLIGVLAGVAIAGAAFAYRGNHPVNLFALLGILVGIPLIMLVLQLAFLRNGLPMPRSVRDAVSVLSPSRWIGSWLERRFDLGLFASVTSPGLGGRFARWQLIAFGQSFAIGYFAGVLSLAGLLVVFTDLAFGWSTTLQLNERTVFDVVRAISLPWQTLVPAAVPDLELIEASRWYRLEESGLAPDRAAALGRWWPFVMMTIVVYGLLPRVVLAIVASRQLTRATDRLLEEGPDITALLDRLATPEVVFDRPAPEPAATAAEATAPAAALELDRADGVIVWNRAIDDEAAANIWPARQPPLVHVAEGQSQKDRQAALSDLDCQKGRVLVLAKGWEPPLLSFQDMLTDARRELGDGVTLVVVPLDTSGTGVAAVDREVWAGALARHGDAALFVAGASQ